MGPEGVPVCSRHEALTRTPSASLTDGQCTESQHLQAEILGEGPLVCCPLQVSAKLRSAPERPWVQGWGRRGGCGSRSAAPGPSPTGTRSTSPAWADEEGLLSILMRRVFSWTSAAMREPRGVRSLWGPETGSVTSGAGEALLAGRSHGFWWPWASLGDVCLMRALPVFTWPAPCVSLLPLSLGKDAGHWLGAHLTPV